MLPEKQWQCCTFCHVKIHPNDGVTWQGQLPYHKHHTPDKTNKPPVKPVAYTMYIGRQVVP